MLKRWDLDEHEAEILDLAARALDRVLSTRKLIERDGLILDGKAHPAAKIETGNMREFRLLIKELAFPKGENDA